YNRAVMPAARRVLRFVAAVTIVCAIVAFYTWVVRLNPTTVALSFLLAVLVVSASWGLAVAVFTSFVAALAFNFFFLPPVGTLTIADAQNWVALLAFLVTSVIASNLSERVRREALIADERRREVERLYSFSQQLLVSENVVELLNAIPQYLVSTFAVRVAAIYLMDRDRVYRPTADDDAISKDELRAAAARSELVLDRERGLCLVPIRLGMRSIGVFALGSESVSPETLEAIGSLIAVAIERAG